MDDLANVSCPRWQATAQPTQATAHWTPTPVSSQKTETLAAPRSRPSPYENTAVGQDVLSSQRWGLPSFHHVLQGFGRELWKLREPQKGCSRDHHSCQRMLGVETGLARAWLGYLLISNVCCWGTPMWHPDNFSCSLSFRQPRTSAQLDCFLLLFLTSKGFWPHWH